MLPYSCGEISRSVIVEHCQMPFSSQSRSCVGLFLSFAILYYGSVYQKLFPTTIHSSLASFPSSGKVLLFPRLFICRLYMADVRVCMMLIGMLLLCNFLGTWCLNFFVS